MFWCSMPSIVYINTYFTAMIISEALWPYFRKQLYTVQTIAIVPLEMFLDHMRPV